MGVLREVPAPGMQNARAPWEVGADAPLVWRQPLEGTCRGGAQRVIRAAVRRAEKGAEGLRDGTGQEPMRPRQWLGQVVLEPWRRLMRLALGTVAVATGMRDAVLAFTVWALREAVAVMATTAGWDGAAALAVGAGQVGGALPGLRGKRGAEVAPGGHGRSPGRRGVRRSEASACPWWGRWRSIMGVSSGVGPRERWRSRGWTPASRRGVAEEWRSVWRAPPRVVLPARCVAVRKAPWTLARRMGKAAVGLWR